MLELTVRVTKVDSPREYRTMDNEIRLVYDCEAVEAHPEEGQYANRICFSSQTLIKEGDIVNVTVNLSRKTFKTRDGRDFTKNEVNIINPRIVTPETF